MPLGNVIKVENTIARNTAVKTLAYYKSTGEWMDEGQVLDCINDQIDMAIKPFV
jgi:hypothetical protein